MSYVHETLKKYFLLALKSNSMRRIDELDWSEGKPIKGWIKGFKFPVLLHRQIFTNKDGSIGILNSNQNGNNLSKTMEHSSFSQKYQIQ